MWFQSDKATITRFSGLGVEKQIGYFTNSMHVALIPAIRVTLIVLAVTLGDNTSAYREL